jgi:hypothetical protein
MLDEIKRYFNQDKVLYTQHARREMRYEPFGRILEQEVFQAIIAGEMIETYPQDTPYPSCLILGFTNQDRAIHAVCAHEPELDQVIVITVYEPDPELWVDYRRRKSL